MSDTLDPEMQCHCEHCECKSYVRYMHHDDWSEESDWACDECVEKCYKQEGFIL
jgi:hypothetical protein